MRRAAALSSLAALLLLGGCQTADLPFSRSGSKPASQIVVHTPPVPPPPAPAPAAAPAAAPPPAAALLVPAKPAKEEVRAALLVPLSGPNAALGAMLSNAAQLALFEVADQHFNLIPLDTTGTPDGAAAAARQAIAQGADIILGPMFSSEVKAAAPVAREQVVPMLAFTTDQSALGNGVYSLGILPRSQVKTVVARAVADNRSRFAALAPNSDYGRAMVEALRSAALETGTKVVRVEYYDPASRDFASAAKRFVNYEQRRGDLEKEKRANAGRSGSHEALAALEGNMLKLPYDAVLLPDDGVRLTSVASLITYYGIDPGPVRLLGTMLWNDPRVAAEPSLQGGWYPAPPAAAHADFEARYIRSFGSLPPRLGDFASTAYDATALAAALARQGQGGDFSVAALTNPNGFAGVDGIFRLSPDGTCERGLAVREVARDGAREVAPAPTTFTVATQ